MGKKRPSPLEYPPSASSSGEEKEREIEEDEVNDREEEEDDVNDIEEEEEELDDDEDDEETIKSRFSVKKYDAPNSEPKSSSMEEDSDSESDLLSVPLPDSTQTSHRSNGADGSIKPDENPKLRKPKSTIVPTKRSTIVKPQIEADRSEKRRKKLNDVQDESEKKSFQRLWSEEDEIVILKGMVNYMKKGLIPNSDPNGFLEFIKDSLHVEANKEQLFNKIRRFKQKYQANEMKEKNGEELSFPKTHDSKCYELSKKIWGEKGVKVDELEGKNGNGKSRKNRGANNGTVSSEQEAIATKSDVLPSQMESEVEKGRNFLNSFSMNELIQSGKDLIKPPSGLVEFLKKEGFQMIESSKAKGFEQKWKELQIAETKLYLKRIGLIQEQTKLVLEALESSNP